jgi:hypothetical protein
MVWRPERSIIVVMPILHAVSYRSLVTPPESPPITRLYGLTRAVLTSIPCESSPYFAELERMVRVTAAGLRDGGSRPEEMVIALKRATRRGSLPQRSRSPEDDLHYRMILWSVLEFFRCG